MSESVLTKPKRKSNADYKIAVAEMFAEITRLNEQMHHDEADITRLKIETEALKAETLRLKSETRAALARLGATL